VNNEISVYERLMKDYNQELTYSRIKGERIAQRLDALSQIGKTAAGGVTRPGYSNEELSAKRLVIQWMKEAGLEVSHDGAGNVYGRLQGKTAQTPVASGSHLDSVPNGGNFDGVLGVLSALEVAESWNEEGYIPKVPFEVVIFSEEEGSRLGGLFGSRAFVGEHTKDELEHLISKDDKSFDEIIIEYGSSIDNVLNINKKDYAFFTEVHIEQGSVLEEVDQPVGIVNGIAGPLDLNIVFKGESGHAGNTPMTHRKDPLVAAGLFVNEISKLPKQFSDTAVATVGELNVFPNGPNVIPGQVELTVDVRDITESQRSKLVEAINHKGEEIAEKYKVGFESKQDFAIKPMPIDEKWQCLLDQTLKEHSIQPTYIPSGAGHDSMIIGQYTPTAMLFVRSQKGISHTPQEWSMLDDCVIGVHVLSDFLKKIIEKQ